LAVDGSGGPSISMASPKTMTARLPSLATPLLSPQASALARCVGDVDEFASQFWGRRPLVQRAGPSGGHEDVFSDVLSLDAVDEFVVNGARLPAVRMVANGIPLAPAKFCSPTRLGGRQIDDVVDPVKVVARLGEGATLVLQSLHRTVPPVAAFVTRLQDEISHPVQANAYLTPPAAAGLAEHADLHDVLALQLHGSKYWWVEGLGDVTMRPGDVMYVPRGTRHRAETSGAMSLHLTIGIIRVTRRQMIERLLRNGSETLDTPLPIGYRHRAQRNQFERAIDAALDDVLDLIGSTDLGAVADREQSRRLERPPRAGRISSLARIEELDADTVICWVAPEPLARAVDETDGRLGHWDGLRCNEYWSTKPERVTVHLGDHVLTLPTTALESLRTLSNGKPVRVGNLPGLDEPSRIVLAKRLVREAACVVASPDSSSPAARPVWAVDRRGRPEERAGRFPDPNTQSRRSTR